MRSVSWTRRATARASSWVALFALCACEAQASLQGPAPTGSPAVTGARSLGSTATATVAASSGPGAVPTVTTSASAATSPAAPTSPVAHLAFVGDLSFSMRVGAILDGKIRLDVPRPGFPFENVADRLRSYDLLVGNLECVVGQRGAPQLPRPLTASLKTPQVLLDAGFDVVSVENNHAQDMGDAGYAETMRQLDLAGLPYIGGSLVHTEHDPTLIREVNGVKIALIGLFNRNYADSFADIARAKKKADLAIVFIHWGIDLGPRETRHQRQYGRALIDAGADAVIGAHSHIIQPVEEYKGKLIVHSLGNFVFSGMVKPGTRTSGIFELDVDKSGLLAHRWQKVKIDFDGAPSLVGEPTADPPFDPPGPRPPIDMGPPIDFSRN